MVFVALDFYVDFLRGVSEGKSKSAFAAVGPALFREFELDLKAATYTSIHNEHIGGFAGPRLHHFIIRSAIAICNLCPLFVCQLTSCCLYRRAIWGKMGNKNNRGGGGPCPWE